MNNKNEIGFFLNEIKISLKEIHEYVEELNEKIEEIVHGKDEEDDDGEDVQDLQLGENQLISKVYQSLVSWLGNTVFAKHIIVSMIDALMEIEAKSSQGEWKLRKEIELAVHNAIEQNKKYHELTLEKNLGRIIQYIQNEIDKDSLHD